MIVVQKLLNRVPCESGGPIPQLKIDGKCGTKTKEAIQKFQLHHFGWHGADGRVDPNKRTHRELERFEKGFTGCSTDQINTLKGDIKKARQMLDVVNVRLSTNIVTPTPAVVDMRQKVKNIFNIDLLSPLGAETAINAFRFTLLVHAFRRLRSSLDESFPIICHEAGLRNAWVSPNYNDPTVNFSPAHFSQTNCKDRAVTIVHERAHTIFHLPDPHPGTPDVFVNVMPHEDKKLRYEDASRNAYCYEWLTLSLQRDYDPRRFSDTIQPSAHRVAR